MGVVIDQHLTWEDHISLITKKNSKNIGVIARIRHLLPTIILISLYYTMIFPYLSYCNIVWGASYKSHLHNLFVLQKRVIRMICKLPYLATSLPSFIKLKQLTIEQINRYQVLLFMHRFHHQGLPSSIPFDLQKGVDIHDHNTRSSHSYRSHRARIKVKQLSMHCIGPDMWNKLPDSLKDVQSLGSFKSLLKKCCSNLSRFSFFRRIQALCNNLMLSILTISLFPLLSIW